MLELAHLKKDQQKKIIYLLWLYKLNKDDCSCRLEENLGDGLIDVYDSKEKAIDYLRTLKDFETLVEKSEEVWANRQYSYIIEKVEVK